MFQGSRIGEELRNPMTWRMDVPEGSYCWDEPFHPEAAQMLASWGKGLWSRRKG